MYYKCHRYSILVLSSERFWSWERRCLAPKSIVRIIESIFTPAADQLFSPRWKTPAVFHDSSDTKLLHWHRLVRWPCEAGAEATCVPAPVPSPYLAPRAWETSSLGSASASRPGGRCQCLCECCAVEVYRGVHCAAPMDDNRWLGYDISLLLEMIRYSGVSLRTGHS